MQSPVPVLNVVTIPPGATDTQARIVIDGVRGAIFVYQNGGPVGALIGSWAKSAGTDPYGNSYPQGLSVDLGSFTGVQEFIYSGTPGPGNPPIFAVSKSTTDPFGNSIRPGDSVALGPVIAIGPTPAGGTPSFVEIVAGTALNILLGTGDPDETSPASLITEISGGGGGRTLDTFVSAPTFASGIGAELLLGSQSEDRTSQGAYSVLGSSSGNEMFIGDQAGSGTPGFLGKLLSAAGNETAFQPATSGSGNFQVPNPVDGNTYTVGRLTELTTSTITINSTSPITIVSVPVAAQAYRVRIHIVYLGGSTASSAVLGWDGSATISNVLGTLRRARISTFTDNVVPINQNSSVGNFSLAFNSGELETYEFEGVVTFSAAGTFNVRGQEATSGDTWAVGINSYIELMPIG